MTLGDVDAAAIGELLQGAVDSGTFHGVGAIVVDREGVLYEGAAGASGTDTLYRNASMTKALATAGALQLVEQGRLDLDAPVASVVPEFGELQVLDGFDGETPRLRPPATQATIRQLATHTSGCGYFFTNAQLLRYQELTGLPSPLAGEKRSLSGPLARDPGTMWEYGVSTDWLGLVVEAVSGQPLDAYLAEHLFGPLGMSDTTFAPTPEQRERLLPVMGRTPDGGLAPSAIDLPPEPEWMAAGHGSYGTPADYARFIRALLRDGELDGARVLNADTIAMAFSDQIVGVPMPELIKTAFPELSNDIPALPVPQGWGLGFHLVNVDMPGMRSAGTGDWAGIFNSYYWVDRTAGVGAVLMTQVLPFFDAKVIETLIGFELAIYASR